MAARMENPAAVLPDAMEAALGLYKAMSWG